MKNVIRWFTLPALFVLIVGFGSLPATADHVAAKHRNMDLLYTSGPTGATNSDLAFWGNFAYQGYYNGFRIFNISNPAAPVLVTDLRCPGAQNDLSVFDRDGNGQADILFTSTDSVMTRSDCAATQKPLGEWEDPGGWEGIRIFDISNPAAPRLIQTVYQDCGSHTHTLWPDAGNNRVLLWNSSYPLRPGPTCGPNTGPSAGKDPLHGVLQIVEVGWDEDNPLGPITAGEIAEPPVRYPGDADNKFDPQEHGLPAESPAGAPLYDLRACHDIGVFVGRSIAGGACAEQAQMWRVNKNGIPDTQNPIWVYDDRVDETGVTGNPNDKGVVVDFWHSATFSWDGKVVNFIDESFGSGCPPTTTAGTVDGDSGRMFFFDTDTGRLRSNFYPPRTETASGAYCSAHLGIPVLAKDRYLLVNAWYQAGVNVVDFSDPSSPNEVAYWDFDPAGPSGSDNWSAYWYEGPQVPGGGLSIYATDGFGNATTARGFEVFRGNVNAKEGKLTHLNPQTQGLLCKGVAGTVFGTPGADVVKGTPANDVIVTGPGNDRIVGLTGKDLICAGAGRDKVSGSGGNDRIFGEAGNDNLRGSAGRDRLVGGKGRKDRCHGGPGKDRAAKSCEIVLQVP